MTDVRSENLKFFLEVECRLKPGQNMLVIADDYAQSVSLASEIASMANSMGIEAVTSVMKARQPGEEPPPTVAEAMKFADLVVQVFSGYEVNKSAATKAAMAAGLPRYLEVDPTISEVYLRNQRITLDDYNKIKTLGAKLSEIFSKGETAKLTTPYGTDLRCLIKDRPGRSLHQLDDYPAFLGLGFAEASVAPIEGTTEGVMIVNSTLGQGLENPVKPIRVDVTKGRVAGISSQIPEQEEQLKALLTIDEGAGNCAAEIGIGTSHVLGRHVRGGNNDFGLLGTIHLAWGKNNHFGGTTESKIHQDFLFTEATLEIDGVCIVKDGEIMI